MNEPTVPEEIHDAGDGIDGKARVVAALRHARDRSESCNSDWRVRVFDARDAHDARALVALIEATPALRVVDTIEAQIRDLLRSRCAGKPVSATAWQTMRQQLLAPTGEPAASTGATDAWGHWVYRPWAKTLVHVLPEALFTELRLDRNRLRIRADEQNQLRQRCVAVAGLSVGQAIALCLAQEGVAGSFRLADPDQLDLSNLNRLRAGVHELGLTKLALAARAMLDIDPFLQIDGLDQGVSIDDPDALLLRSDGRPVDLLIEECDDLPIKVALRLRARALGIPVVMATSEGGLLDIERFDLEPGRPIFHGLAENIDLEALVGGDDDARAAFVLSVLGRDVLSARTAASLVELRQSVTSWPQLASAVALGAAQVTDVARRIFLGGARVSGRLRVDLAAEPGARPPREPGAKATTAAPANDGPSLRSDDLPDAVTWRRLARECTTALTAEARQAVLDAAAMAPSGGNAQPWRLIWHGDTLAIYDRPEAPVPGMDPHRFSVAMAAGSVAENAAIAASALGWSAEIRPAGAAAGARAPEPRAPNTRAPGGTQPLPICEVAFTPGREPPDPLLPWLTARCTNRRLQDSETPPGLSPDERDALAAQAQASGGAIWLFEDATSRAQWGEVAGSADRLRFLHGPWLRELAAEVRFDAAPTEGLDVRSLEMSAASRAILPMLLDPSVMAEVAAVDGGDGLRKPARDAFAASSAIALLGLPDGTIATLGPIATMIQAGRLLQRVWLRATALGLSVHPWGSALFLRGVERTGALAASPGADMLTAPLRTALSALADDVDALLPAAVMPTMLMRLARCPPPTARSLRRRLDQGVASGATAGATTGIATDAASTS